MVIVNDRHWYPENDRYSDHPDIGKCTLLAEVKYFLDNDNPTKCFKGGSLYALETPYFEYLALSSNGDFRYDGAGRLVDGTVTSISVTDGFTKSVEILNTNADASTLYRAMTTYESAGDDSGLRKIFLNWRYEYRGSSEWDDFTGGNRADLIVGRGGFDILSGGRGADIIKGGAGRDNLSGGSGKDRLSGGFGSDDLDGGAGADIFDFNRVGESKRGATDFISSFERGFDKIDLKDIDADTDGTSGNQDFNFIGTRAFSGVDGQLRYEAELGYATVTADVNGDKAADLRILVDEVAALSKSDFLGVLL